MIRACGNDDPSMGHQTDPPSSSAQGTSFLPGAPSATVTAKHTGSQFLPQRTSDSSPHDSIVYRCGHCLAPMSDLGADLHLRCDGCGHRNAMPVAFWVCCDQCSFENRIRTRDLAFNRKCASCREQLVVDDLVLTPLVRRRRRVRCYESSSSGRSSVPHDKGAIAFVAIAAAVLISLKLLQLV